jgi:serpin B
MIRNSASILVLSIFLWTAGICAAAEQTPADNWGSGALCDKCKGKVFTTDIGVCADCGRGTSSGAFKLCQACAKRLNQCQACRGPLGGEKKIVTQAAPEADPKAIVTGNTAFALDLYGKLHGEKDRAGKNIFLSPYSISTALAMTYAGAKGETETQMAKVMHFDLSQDKLHPAFQALETGYNAPGKKYKLQVANSLWGQSGYHFRDEFLKLTKERYNGGFRECDYIKATEDARKTTNAWVEEKTEKKIVELIKKDILSVDTRLVLTNAIYFKGDWAVKFDKKDTVDAPFTLIDAKTVKAPLMHRTGEYGYMADKEFQVLDAPYAGDELAMTVILPKKADGLKTLETGMTPDWLAGCLDKIQKEKVAVYLPRFKTTCEFEMKDTLVSMGMSAAFGNAADFSGMTGNKDLFISKVVHKAFVDVNEEGTEAAAATAVVMDRKAVAAMPPVFRADRPFLFLIRDAKTGSVLFLGRVMDPTKE